MNPPLFLGIDLSGKAPRPSAWALLDAEPRLVGWGCAGDERLLTLAEEHRPSIVAIDAPLSLPWGLCCLEESCPCQPSAARPGRAAEWELSRRGIPSFYVTKRTFIKEMVYRGMALRRALESRGHRAIEVYPYASKVALWGRALPRKQNLRGRAFTQQRLEERVAGLDAAPTPPSHDALDAVVAAYTALLYWHGRTEAVGDAAEGLVYLPRLPVANEREKPGTHLSLRHCPAFS